MKEILIGIVGGAFFSMMFALDVTEIDDIVCNSANETSSILGSGCDDAVSDLVGRGFPFTFLEGAQDVAVGDLSFSVSSAALNFGFWAVVSVVLFWIISSALKFTVKLAVMGLIVAAIGFFYGFDRLF